MAKITFATFLCLLFCQFAIGQSKSYPDDESFTLTATAPPTPAMKYELCFDPIDQTDGNAADFYKQAAGILTPAIRAQIESIQDAAEAHDANFVAAESAFYQNNRKLFELLESAGRCEHADWDDHIRQKGVSAVMPELVTARDLAIAAYNRAVAQIRTGHPVDAVATLRLGYAVARHFGETHILLSGLVAVGDQRMMDEPLAEMLSHPRCPNLYWALAKLPRSLALFKRDVGGERVFTFATWPILYKARTEPLTDAEWNTLAHSKAAALCQLPVPSNPPPALDIQEAKSFFAQTDPSAVARLDGTQLVWSWYFAQYQIKMDDYWKLVDLSYPLLYPRLLQEDGAVGKLKKQEPDDPFAPLIAGYADAAHIFMLSDRKLAALQCVEALRSYAAGHDGKLPVYLSDITETPPPDNPRTGKPFDYALTDQVAVLSDTGDTDRPLKYTIKIRQ